MPMHWYGEEVRVKVEQAAGRRVAKCGRFLANEIRVRLSEPGVRKGSKGKKKKSSSGPAKKSGSPSKQKKPKGFLAGVVNLFTKVRKGSKRKRKPFIARTSRPGEYPRKVTGHFRRNVVAEYDQETMVSRVGTNVLYGKYLETGTKRMGRRPWLGRSVVELAGQMRRILQGGG